MDYKINTAFLVAVQVHYPGGLKQFNEYGGSVAYVPGMPPQILAYLPQGGEQLRETIRQKCTGLPCSIVFVDVPNFGEMQPDEIYAEVWRTLPTFPDKTLLKRVSVSLSRACVIYNIMGWTEVMQRDLDKLADLMRQLSGFRVGAILHCRKTMMVYAHVIKTEVVSGNTQPLTADDEMNVKILLHGVNTVEDFLRRM